MGTLGARAEPGRYRLRVSEVAGNAPVTLLWSRPMWASAYEVRNLLAHMSAGLLIGAVAAWCAVVSWLLMQPVRTDFSSGRK